MKSKRNTKSSKASRRRNVVILYLFLAVLSMLIAYMLYTSITPQLASLLASIDGTTSANASKTAMVNFVYVK